MERRKFGIYDEDAAAYTLTHDAGFFSNVVVGVLDILILLSERKAVCAFDGRRSFTIYADAVDQDVYGEFFVNDDAIDLGMEVAAGRVREKDRPEYAKFGRKTFAGWPIEAASGVFSKFFTFAPPARQEVKHAADGLGLDFSKTACIYYRATDKANEFALTPVEAYIARCERLIAQEPDLKVLAQSDDVAARDAIMSHFGSRAVCLPDVPISRDGQPLHLGTKSNRLANVKPFITAFGLMVQCKYIICTSSNVSFAMALARKSGDNMSVFYSNGRSVDYLDYGR
ncbi:MAG: hypothetical protein ACKVP5_15610 [Aestuariivirga sp.]